MDHPLPDDLEIRVPTPAQHRIILQNTRAEWGSHLTAEQYIHREAFLGASAFAQGNLCAFVLVRKSAAADTDQLFSHCEIYKRPAVVRRSGAKAADAGQVEDVSVIGVASVFTPSHFRRRGYSGRMMRLVREHCERVNGAVASHLYSDVGPVFYDKNGGWKSHRIHMVRVDPATAADTGVPLYQVEHLTRDAVGEIIDRDVERVRMELAALPESELPACAILPTRETMLWHWLRADFYAPIFKQAIPEHCGVRVKGSDAFMFWQHAFNNDKLYVLRSHCSTPSEAALLLEVTRKEAARCKLKIVEIWVTNEAKESGVWDGVADVIPRPDEDSLPALAWFHANDPVDGGDVHWLHNEKFGWL